MGKLKYEPSIDDRADEIEMIKTNIQGIIDEIEIYDDIKEILYYVLIDDVEPEANELEEKLREQDERELREREREWYNSRL